MQKMTKEQQYEEGRQELQHAFEERKAINKRFLTACESKLSSTTTENPTKYVIGKLAFQEIEDMWDHLERMSLTLSFSIQNLDNRIQYLEGFALEMGAKINLGDIASVAKFAEEFRNHIEESKKKLIDYKRKMEENDLAT
jgi:hypothetical protein